MTHAWVWPVLFALGCYHGINPGMGWLFAVALGLQEKSRQAVVAALPPIALGHVVSVGTFIALAAVAQRTLPEHALRYGAAALLLLFGLYRLVRARHMRWVGMRVGFWGLATWSFLMATGHGAGLMLLPFLSSSGGAGHSMIMGTMHAAGAASAGALPAVTWAWAIGVHTFGYLLTMTGVAWIVFAKVGVQFLRTAWFNFDLAWAAALIVSGALMLFL
ncbi:MAG TPA: hypothetical protein VGQ96_01715 [Candidatus Eremiobacteraceae bacterium]|nr:hypothetical protein [Candidatus Eremiobacteraceae bacterium]